MNVRRIVFLRPGETDWNREGRWQGWVAAPLNAQGLQQVGALAKFVRHIGMGALYTSDLKRAMQTAEILAGALGFAPTPDERLRERAIGQWQGLTVEEMAAWYPAEYGQMMAQPDAFRVPGGESRDDVRERVTTALNDILGRETHETIGILSHTSAIKILLETLVPNYEPLYVRLDNTSVTTIHRKDDGDSSLWEVAAVNDRLHLEGLEARYARELEANKS